MALSRQLQQPQFTGDWIEFIQQFDDYIEGLATSSGAAHPGAMDEHAKLRLLVGSVGEINQREFRLRREAGEDMSYAGFRAWLAHRYGGELRSTAREQLRALRPRMEGKLRQEDWRDLWSRFKLLWSRVEDPSDEEARNWVLDRIPGAFRERLLREEAKKAKRNPTLKVGELPGIDASTLAQFCRTYVGDASHVSVHPASRGFLVQVGSAMESQNMLTLIQKMLNGGRVLHVTPTSSIFLQKKFFGWMDAELGAQAASDGYGKAWSTIQKDDRRSVRAAENQAPSNQEPASPKVASSNKSATPPRRLSNTGQRQPSPTTNKPAPSSRDPARPQGGRKPEPSRGERPGPNRPGTPPRSPRDQSRQPSPYACTICGEKTHKNMDCPMHTCGACREKGHNYLNCPRGCFDCGEKGTQGGGAPRPPA